VTIPFPSAVDRAAIPRRPPRRIRLGRSVVPRFLSSVRTRLSPDDTSPQPTTPSTPWEIKDFERFFHTYERALTGYLWRLTGDDDAACDLAQETFVRAWQRFAEVQHYAHQRAWLFRVATNLALNHLRQRAHPIDVTALPETTPQLHLADPMVNLIERHHIIDSLQQLPPRQRAVLILRAVYDLSYQEMGNVLGISFEAAKIALRRARIQFRATYFDHQEHEA
jgi:RNA polymerase sigma factor (sigma-70 family)